MGTGTTAAMVMALASVVLAEPAPGPSEAPASGTAEAPALEVSLGIGYVVSRTVAGEPVPAPRPAAPEPTGPHEPPASAQASAPAQLAPYLPPPSSDFTRVQGSPGARGLLTAAAIATQMGMVVAGIISVREQRQRGREARSEQLPLVRPYR